MTTELPTAQEVHDQPLSLQMAQEVFRTACENPTVKEVLGKIAVLVREAASRGQTQILLSEIEPTGWKGYWRWPKDFPGSSHPTAVAVLQQYGYQVTTNSYGEIEYLTWDNPKPVH